MTRYIVETRKQGEDQWRYHSAHTRYDAAEIEALEMTTDKRLTGIRIKDKNDGEITQTINVPITKGRHN